MKVVSGAGEFLMTIDSMSVENNELVLKGTMGVWASTTYFTAAEMTRMLVMSLKPSVLFYLLRLPFLYVINKFRREKD